MKKLIAGLAVALVLTGCTPQPEPVKNLDHYATATINMMLPKFRKVVELEDYKTIVINIGDAICDALVDPELVKSEVVFAFRTANNIEPLYANEHIEKFVDATERYWC